MRFERLLMMSGSGKAAAYTKLLAGIIRLRQICCDPRLVTFNQAASMPIPATVQALLIGLPDGPSAKTLHLCCLVSGIIEIDHGAKILTFSEWTQHLNLIQRALEHDGHTFLMYEGQMSSEERTDTLRSFDFANVRGCLLTLGAGAVGLTMTQATHVILACPAWNPQREHQAEDRAYRIGQTKDVMIHKLHIQNTIEDVIFARQRLREDYAMGVLRRGRPHKVGTFGHYGRG